MLDLDPHGNQGGSTTLAQIQYYGYASALIWLYGNRIMISLIYIGNAGLNPAAQNWKKEHLFILILMLINKK
jgi:hypothetical protein